MEKSAVIIMIIMTAIISCCSSSDYNGGTLESGSIDVPADEIGYPFLIELDTLNIRVFKKPYGEDECILKIENKLNSLTYVDTVKVGTTIFSEAQDLEKDGNVEIKLSFSTNWTWSIYYTVSQNHIAPLRLDHPIQELHFIDGYYYDYFGEECQGDNISSSLLIKRNDSLINVASFYYVNCDREKDMWLIEEDSTKLKRHKYKIGKEREFWKDYIQSLHE